MGAAKQSIPPTPDRDDRLVPGIQTDVSVVSSSKTIADRFGVKQAATYAGVCPSIIYGLCAAQSISHYRVGGKGRRGKIVIHKTDLDAYLESCRVGSKPQPVASDRPSRPKLRHLRLPS